jgi:DNA polymerase-1
MGDSCLRSCPGCPFGGARVGSRGPSDSPFVIIGESPGKEEVKAGIPFVGESGTILFNTIPKALDVEPFITNALYCHPRKELKEEHRLNSATRMCQQRLWDEVAEYPRKMIVAMGNPALRGITNDFSHKITRSRGGVYDSHFSEHGVVAAIHPAALMRGTGTYRRFRQDLGYAVHLYNGGPRRSYIVPEVVVCDNNRDIFYAVRDLRESPLLVADAETSGLNPRTDDILCLGVARADRPERVYIFPEGCLGPIKLLLEAKAVVWHNGKFDIAFLRKQWIDASVAEDTMLLSYVIDETSKAHDLEQVAWDEFGIPRYKDMVKQWVRKKSDSFALIPKPVLYEYLGYDVSNTVQIFGKLRKQVEEDAASNKLYTKTLIPASELLYHVEKRGISVDLAWLRKLIKRLEGDVEVKVKEIQKIAGYDINPASPEQMAVLLFDEMRFKRKRKRSTSKEVLKLLPQRPIIKALKAFREAQKALSAARGIERAVQEDGRVHSTFQLHITKTGRLSSRKPNMQNPARDPEQRGVFVAEKGSVLIEVDYNQAELRSLADQSGDEWLLNVYRSTGRSLHDEVAAEFFGKNFGHEDKMKAKAVNFGIVYGRLAHSLAEGLRIPISEAQSYIDKWFERMPGAHKYVLRCRQAARRGETITTPFGSKKRHQLVTKMNVHNLQNEAANFPHQNIASTLTLQAAIELRPLLEAMGVYIVNLIHDAILVECPNDQELIIAVVLLMIKVMEAVPPKWGFTRCPFKADAKTGTRWGHLKEIDPYDPGSGGSYSAVLEGEQSLRAA